MPTSAPPPEPALGRLAVRMAELRRQRGLTYEQLAEASGLSRRGVIALERGERAGEMRSWYLVARALDVSFGDFVGVLDR
ncbi:helix-turn-helix transcriptional regulator [Microbacterium sp. X-17]|uniref:helix-turn-helix transcriptional regulator n=1 Tax=Microbacterium sp. X-17 TaxID=3144404 RepID=UPI0031F500BF